MKLYYLYYKRIKKLRSLKELMDELDNLLDLTDNFVKDDGMVPIRACGTRWIGHLVKVLQRIISKFRIYLTDLKNFGEKERKAKIKPKFFWLSQKMARLFIPTWDGILFAHVDAIEKTFVRLLEKDSYSY